MLVLTLLIQLEALTFSQLKTTPDYHRAGVEAECLVNLILHLHCKSESSVKPLKKSTAKSVSNAISGKRRSRATNVKSLTI
jgi:hypothetical protein